MRRFLAGLLVLISALALTISSTSLWVRHNVINTQVFVANAEAIVDLPAVQARINDQVTGAVMKTPQVQNAITAAVGLLPKGLQRFRPVVANGAQSLVSAGVRAVLASQAFRPLIKAAVSSAQTQLVNGQPVRFTLGQAKRFVPPAAQSGLAGQALALIPNDLGITVLKPADAPQLYTAIDLLKGAWFWAGLLAVLALAGALWAAHRRRAVLIGWSITTALLVLGLVIALRVAPAFLLPQVQTANRDAVSAVYDLLAGSLVAWTLWVGAGALVVLIGTLLWGHVGLFPAIRRGAAATRRRLHEMREARAGAAAAPAEAGAAGATVAARESWPRRVAAGTRAFFDNLGLDERTAGLGTFVRAHLAAARWLGVGVGALVLLFWPSPTLSVLFWIAALVGLYLALVQWLQGRAPAKEAIAVPGAEAAAPVGEPAPAGLGVEQTPAPVAIGAAAGAEAAGRPDGHRTPPPPVPVVEGTAPVAPAEPAAEEPIVPAGLTPEAITALSERLDLLVRLSAAHESGVLTDDEFGREKSRLLRR